MVAVNGDDDVEDDDVVGPAVFVVIESEGTNIKLPSVLLDDLLVVRKPQHTDKVRRVAIKRKILVVDIVLWDGWYQRYGTDRYR